MPAVVRAYDHYLMNNARWNAFVPRDDDVVISTSIKSGTTWMQAILWHLLVPPAERGRLHRDSPWLETTIVRPEAMLAHLEKQRHRRFIKSHLALDGLPFHDDVRYIVVARDARDVFMSLWNHHANLTYLAWRRMVARANRFGCHLERPRDVHAFWREWITRGWFAWEHEGYPYWGNLHHTATWWRQRNRDNVLFVHFNDLLSDLPGEIRRVVDFLDIEASRDQVDEVAAAVTFDNMRRSAGRWLSGIQVVFKGGASTFVHKGTNGRWRGVLGAEDLDLYDRAASLLLEPECRAWLEEGGSTQFAR